MAAYSLATSAYSRIVDFFEDKNRFLIKTTSISYFNLLKDYRKTIKQFLAHYKEKKRYYRNLKKKKVDVGFSDLFNEIYNKKTLANLKALNYTNNSRKLKVKRKYKWFYSRYRSYSHRLGRLFLNIDNQFYKLLLDEKYNRLFVRLLLIKTKKIRVLNNKPLIDFYNLLDVDFAFNSHVANNVVSHNLYQIFTEIQSRREKKLRTVGLEYLIINKARRQKRFEDIFWKKFLALINNKYLPFINVNTQKFRKKYRRYYQAKRFLPLQSRDSRISQFLNIKLFYSIKLTHNGLRKKKQRRM